MNKVNIILIFRSNLLIKFSHCDKKSCHCERSEAIQNNKISFLWITSGVALVPKGTPLANDGHEFVIESGNIEKY